MPDLTVKEMQAERLQAISQLKSQVASLRRSHRGGAARCVARTLYRVYGVRVGPSDYEHVAAVEDMQHERICALEAEVKRLRDAIASPPLHTEDGFQHEAYGVNIERWDGE